jgi:asparagine synthase (glutamine-hydrolysing)
VQETLAKSVSLRGRADVPVGAFLSGGVDSTAVCSTLIESGYRDVRAFTISLPNHPEDEALAASAIAKHLGIRHDVIPLDVDPNGRWLDEALAAMDVPSIDGPNTWLVSRAVANAGLKVACSGLGGDELFYGYPSFTVVPKAARLTKPARFLRFFRPQTTRFGARLPTVPRLSRAIDACLVGGSLAALWFAKRGLYSAGEVRRILTEAAWETAQAVDPLQRIDELPIPEDIDPKRKVSYLELSVYMHDQLLRDTDAMSMAHGLEVRVPLIARPMVELVGQLSATSQSGPRPKWLLRQAIRESVPSCLLDRPKRGFALNWSSLWGDRGSRPLPAVLHHVVRASIEFRQTSLPRSSPPGSLVLHALALNLQRHAFV